MIVIFQKEFKLVITEAEEMPMEIFCALTNSNVKFLSAMRGMIEKVKKFEILKEDEIMMAMGYSKLMKNFADISNLAFKRIEEVATAQVSGQLQLIKDYKKFNIVRGMLIVGHISAEHLEHAQHDIQDAYSNLLQETLEDHLRLFR